MQQSVPQHVAIIMDGNGRWAKQKHRPRLFGHAAGRKVAFQVVKMAAAAGVKVLTLFAFGQENWRRPASEVSSLMRLFIESFDLFLQELKLQGVALRFIGERGQLSEKIQHKIEHAEQYTASGERMTLVVAMNYSGRWDMQQAIQRLQLASLRAADAHKAASHNNPIESESKSKAEAETAAATQPTLAVTDYLATAELPDPDLLIRTGGARRISNFMLWQLAYTELYFLDCLWPDFAEQDWQAALSYYASQERRFGYTSEQLRAKQQPPLLRPVTTAAVLSEAG